MADDAPGLDGLIASRLDLLFRTVHPAGRGPYSIAEVVSAINASGEDSISVGYLWQLRKGHRDNPTYKHLLALSRFFGVSPVYFFPEEDAGRGAVPADAALALKDDAVREIALRAAGLSERSLQVIRDMIPASAPWTRRGRVPAAARRQPQGMQRTIPEKVDTRPICQLNFV
jgi:transcriptional regulator with XRE-family HTH domain